MVTIRTGLVVFFTLIAACRPPAAESVSTVKDAEADFQFAYDPARAQQEFKGAVQKCLSDVIAVPAEALFGAAEQVMDPEAAERTRAQAQEAIDGFSARLAEKITGTDKNIESVPPQYAADMPEWAKDLYSKMGKEDLEKALSLGKTCLFDGGFSYLFSAYVPWANEVMRKYQIASFPQNPPPAQAFVQATECVNNVGAACKFQVAVDCSDRYDVREHTGHCQAAARGAFCVADNPNGVSECGNGRFQYQALRTRDARWEDNKISCPGNQGEVTQFPYGCNRVAIPEAAAFEGRSRELYFKNFKCPYAGGDETVSEIWVGVNDGIVSFQYESGAFENNSEKFQIPFVTIYPHLGNMLDNNIDPNALGDWMFQNLPGKGSWKLTGPCTIR